MRCLTIFPCNTSFRRIGQFSDGVQTLSDAGGDAIENYQFGTDAAGDIVDWSVVADTQILRPATFRNVQQASVVHRRLPGSVHPMGSLTAPRDRGMLQRLRRSPPRFCSSPAAWLHLPPCAAEKDNEAKGLMLSNVEEPDRGVRRGSGDPPHKISWRRATDGMKSRA